MLMEFLYGYRYRWLVVVNNETGVQAPHLWGVLPGNLSRMIKG